MVGVEIVLAALPLAIAAVEHYRAGLTPAKDYFRYDSTLKSIRNRLRIEQDLFEGMMKRILLQEISPNQARDLFPDPGQHVDLELWRTIRIDEKLRERLSSKYESFINVVGEMEMIMRQLMERLGIESSWSESTPTLPLAVKSGQWEWRKIKWIFGRKQRELLIRRFEMYNRNIARYVEQLEILAPVLKPRPDEACKYHHLVRENACKVYDALEAGWKCRRSCLHNANLQLERRDSTQSSNLFKISLTFENQFVHSTSSLPNWLEAQFDIDELDEQMGRDGRPHANDFIHSNNGSLYAQPSYGSSTTRAIPLPTTAGKQARRSVRFAEPDDGTKQPYKPQRSRSGTANSLQISSLCDALYVAPNPPTTLGFLVDTSCTQRINISTKTFRPSHHAEPVSLDCLFPASGTPSRERKFFGKLSGQQRLRIAVTLAHTVLELYESPWLHDSWSKSDIYFFCDGLDRYKRPIIDNPYVSRSFKSQAPQEHGPSSAQNAENFYSSLIVNKSLFALGIVLIELALNRSIEDLWAEASHPSTTVSGRGLSTAETYSVATELIDAVYNEQGMQYGYVVQRCLKGEFGVQESMKQLNHDAFRALVYEGVLAPLEDDLK
ncbi:MAG: hypothetical protein Q9225_006986, partial [Loekoesia sp. 1 TL-2023]